VNRAVLAAIRTGAGRLGAVKALFAEIRQGDTAAVTSRLDRDPALVDAVASAPPKKDDGQSALQVALKSGQFAVADLLLDRGADVNHVDSSEINPWNVPIVHDAIRAAVMSARFGRNRALPGAPPRIEITNTSERFEEALGLLTRIIDAGADLNAIDSYGNPASHRAVLDARQIIDEPILPALTVDLDRVFALLLAAGADPDWIDPRAGQTIAQRYADDPVARFLPGSRAQHPSSTSPNLGPRPGRTPDGPWSEQAARGGTWSGRHRSAMRWWWTMSRIRLVPPFGGRACASTAATPTRWRGSTASCSDGRWRHATRRRIALAARAGSR
jgi:hypothetical protein